MLKSSPELPYSRAQTWEEEGGEGRRREEKGGGGRRSTDTSLCNLGGGGRRSTDTSLCNRFGESINPHLVCLYSNVSL